MGMLIGLTSARCLQKAPHPRTARLAALTAYVDRDRSGDDRPRCSNESSAAFRLYVRCTRGRHGVALGAVGTQGGLAGTRNPVVGVDETAE
jgi:hypothetical protein